MHIECLCQNDRIWLGVCIWKVVFKVMDENMNLELIKKECKINKYRRFKML
jgi:hypothetical protein